MSPETFKISVEVSISKTARRCGRKACGGCARGRLWARCRGLSAARSARGARGPEPRCLPHPCLRPVCRALVLLCRCCSSVGALQVGGAGVWGLVLPSAPPRGGAASARARLVRALGDVAGCVALASCGRAGMSTARRKRGRHAARAGRPAAVCRGSQPGADERPSPRAPPPRARDADGRPLASRRGACASLPRRARVCERGSLRAYRRGSRAGMARHPGRALARANQPNFRLDATPPGDPTGGALGGRRGICPRGLAPSPCRPGRLKRFATA